MRRSRILTTSFFRLAILSTGLFAACGVAVLGYVYWAMTDTMIQDIDDGIGGEVAELVEAYRLGGQAGLVRELNQKGRRVSPRSAVYQLATPALEPVAGNLGAWPEAVGPRLGWVDFSSPVAGARPGPPPLMRARVVALPDGDRLLVARDMSERVRFRQVMERALIAGLALTLVLGIFGGLAITLRMLRRLDSFNRTTTKILHGDLSERVPVVGNDDEFDQLAKNANSMLDQINRLLASMREVTDNVAHDLRSPLARLRNRLEMASTQSADLAECRQALRGAITETDRILHTFNALLTITQIESGVLQERFAPFDLTVLAQDAVELYQPLCEEKGLALEARLAPGTELRGSRDQVFQALANLLDNAVKFTPRGGAVTVEVGKAAGRARLVVADSGPGIPENKRDAVLARFVRLDASRGTPGTGLGLSLVAAVAKQHDARLALEDNRPGLRVVIDFPSG